MMATTTVSTASMVFLNVDDKKFTVNLNYVKNDLTAGAIKNLMDTMIVKANIFVNQPYAKVSANLITKNTTELDISD